MIARYRSLFADSRHWLTVAVVLFLGGLLIGYSAAASDPERVTQGLAPVLSMVRRVAEQVTQAGDPVSRALPIFGNNLRAAVVMMLGGVALGIFPAFAMLMNGTVVGVVGALGGRISPQAASPLVFLASLIPHGIFELPAFFLAAAWGMKLGLAWLLPGASGRRRQTLALTARQGTLVLPLCVGLLVVAALIEANVTPLLVHALVTQATAP